MIAGGFSYIKVLPTAHAGNALAIAYVNLPAIPE
jgi:hypothetical protein